MENNLKTLLRAHQMQLKKAYGQNFLTDTFLLDEIVEKAGVTSSDTVLEIGCGAGALTTALAKKAKKVVGYEIDKDLKPVLADTLSGLNNVEIVFNDVMKVSLEEIEKKLGGKYILVANLPYYITTPIVMRFVENSTNIKAMVIMVQEEVAYRLSAKASSSDYGKITVGINLRGSAEVVLKVPREKFTPAPNVDSAVVKIVMDANKFSGVDFIKVRNVVRVAFSSRRKMLVNNLMNGFKINRMQAENVIIKSDLALTCRPENLSCEEYVKLTNELESEGVKL